MTDILTPAERSERMSRVRSKNTRTELTVRKIIHGLGYRYRLHAKELPGKPDIVFRGRKKAIFVHGCFWHRHPDPKCRLARMPKSNLDYWRTKLEHNRERDLLNHEQLLAMGWKCMVIWECELRNQESLVSAIIGFLDE